MTTAAEFFNGANKPKSLEWVGMSPDEAKEKYHLDEIPQTETDTLIDKKICIIGFVKRSGDLGPYNIFLFVPDQEEFEIRSFITGSKAFCERVEMSDLPVAGIVERVQGKKKGAKPYLTLK